MDAWYVRTFLFKNMARPSNDAPITQHQKDKLWIVIDNIQTGHYFLLLAFGFIVLDRPQRDRQIWKSTLSCTGGGGRSQMDWGV